MRYFVSLLLPCALGWSGDGHRVIIDLALRLVDERSMGYLRTHLDGTTFAEASVWADTNGAKLAYPGSEFFHFSSTPYRNCQPFNITRDCGHGTSRGVCIVTGLSDAIAAAVDVSASSEERFDALKFVLHLMADIHQPLHTGFREDYGGNRIRLGTPAETNLHEVWDASILDHFRNRLGGTTSSRWESVAEYIATHRPIQTFFEDQTSHDNITNIDNPLQFVSLIATETVMQSTCRVGYTNEIGQYIGVGDHLSPAYFEARVDIVVTQLIKAASRLANVINLMAATFSERSRAARKEAAEVRRRRLFQESVAIVSTSVVSNPFSVLSDLVFDPNSLQDGALVEGYIVPKKPVSRPGVAVVTTKPSSKKSKKSSKKKPEEDIDALLAETSLMTTETQSYVFFGIDISRVVLIRRNARFIITYKALAKKGYVPTTSTRAEENGIIYFFDYSVFSVLNRELITRTFLKLNGIDPRIDISDLIAESTAVVTAGAAGGGAGGPATTASNETSDSPQERAHWERQRKLLAEIADGAPYTLANRILRLRGGYAYLQLPGVCAFVSLETLRNAKPGTHLRMNVLFGYEGGSARVSERLSSIRSGGTSIQLIFVDPAIYDLGPRNRAELDALIAALSTKKKDKASDHKEALSLRPQIVSELTSLANMVNTYLESGADWRDYFDGAIAFGNTYSHSVGTEVIMKIAEWVALW